MKINFQEIIFLAGRHEVDKERRKMKEYFITAVSGFILKLWIYLNAFFIFISLQPHFKKRITRSNGREKVNRIFAVLPGNCMPEKCIVQIRM